ncbi:hypothetical protein M0D46_20695 [Xanthomonas prunicola]|uniref:hypothetical protein n=1 Tax=Xanthomonas prunicola TaxID=2053930 RepID=UPI0021B23FE6|nr:hypothetical protein [Xanthomonas prunicola]UXA52893.1 hypothetical protein M0D45_20080 [Xanthomonas prunicola]UXA69385.1 hypothetical protein M0D46_20695 [Xanthomonas prunicola]
MGLSLTARACLAVLALLFTASTGMPGDGNQAMQATRMPMLVTLLTGALMTLGGLVASPVAFSCAASRAPLPSLWRYCRCCCCYSVCRCGP